MKLKSYQNLIANLPVKQQSFVTKRSNWKKEEENPGNDWLVNLNAHLFKDYETITISRQDIFNINVQPTKEFLIKTIYWGYPAGMRGLNFNGIAKQIDYLENILADLKKLSKPKISDYKKLVKSINDNDGKGIGLSTFSKFIYFLDISFDDNPSLILDQRIINVFKNSVFDEFSSLKKILNRDLAKEYYPEYIIIMNELANKYQTKGENIEQFLFLFGNGLKE